MPSTRIYSRSFAGGELSPEMYGRIDDAKFQSGAAELRNFVVAPTGTAKNRAGFAYVNSTKCNGVARLIPFTFSLNQTMVIELGNEYARFHTNGETLQYPATGNPVWIPPAGVTITYTLTSPAVFTWTAHGLANGVPIQFYIYGTSTPPPLPAGLVMAYTYTVNVIDANTFTITDPATGKLVALTAPGGSGTNYTGSGTASVSLYLSPNTSGSTSGSPVGGLASVPVSGGIVTVNADITASIYSTEGGGEVDFQYSTDGTNWYDLYSVSGSSVSVSTSIAVPIALSNLDLLQLRVAASGGCGPASPLSASGEINSWIVTIGSGAVTPVPLRAYVYYQAGTIITHSGVAYIAAVAIAGGSTTPGTDAAVWYLLPVDLTLEIPTPFLAADLFDIHYVQSADVMTLVHPAYPPQELQRYGAAAWAMTTIDFGPPLDTPLSVAVAASPGYMAQIASVATGGTGYTGQALITTVASHTLALGNGVYVANLTFTPSVGAPQVLDGFYMVAAVPVDGSGNLIPNELYLMDYSGNNLMFNASGTYSSSSTIQFGTKIFNITNLYAVQAVAPDGVSTSPLSATVSVLDNLDVPGSFNTITWLSVAGAQSYNVYKQQNGLWGFIGNTTALTFADNNIAPDMGITPGTPDAVFTGAGNYPSAVCYFQQRRCFGGTLNAPANAWMSNSGTESMFDYSIPSQATDRIAFEVAALQADIIQHMVPMLELIMLTSESEFALVPVGSSAITPTSVSVVPQSYIGASNVQPTVINTTMVYAAARGGHVRELGYAWTVNGYMTGDLSLRAAHLFDGLTIVDQAYSKSPWPIVWFVSSNGKLLGLTYIPEEQLGAWHEHDTQGTFESIACVAEGTEDVLYAVINRTVNGSTVRYIERMASRIIDPNDSSTWFFVDAGVKQSFGGPVTTISGLTWLEGCTVKVLADGGLQDDRVVSGGAITLEHAATVIAVGLPYTMDLLTLPAVMQLDGYGQGRMKNVNKAWVKVFQSSGIFVGPDADHLTEIEQRTTEPWGTPPALQSAELFVLTSPEWQANGQTLIRQEQPLPLEVVGITLEVAIGG